MKLEDMNSKIEEILKELTLEEKVKMIHGDALLLSREQLKDFPYLL